MRWVLGTKLLLASTSLVHSFSLSLREENKIIDNVGVTSLLARQQQDSGDVDLFVGTKRGKLLHFQYTDGNMELLGELQDELVESKPFPIFSMTSSMAEPDNDDVKPFQLFCGGGDRYITVWQQEQSNNKKWRCSQRLGPHTGWVKDVLYDQHSDTVVSIGCNCIESWKRQVDLDSNGSAWKHAVKRSIESSLEEGATLSSDLLCLCHSGEVNRFYSGGVDGRIHAWSCDVAVKDPLYSIGTHSGRINAMVYSHVASLLFSSGHDGTIQCRRVKAGRPLNTIPDAQIDLLEANVNPARVTALAILQESSDHVKFVAGTATGELTCFEAVVKVDSVVTINNYANARYRIAEEAVINALCVLAPLEVSSSFWPLVIGHSLGLSLMTIERSYR